MQHNLDPDRLPLRIILALSLLVCALLLCLGCKRTIYVPTETVHTEYRDRVLTDLRIDSVYLRDSVSVERRGDTVIMYKYRDRWRERIRERHDTVTAVLRDSVSAPYPVEVERKQTWGERAKLTLFWWLVGGLGAMWLWMGGAAKIRRWIGRRKK